VCTPAPHKREATITRRIGAFIFKIKEAMRTKKKLNLKFFADTYRCKLSDEQAYEVAALFTHWAPAWQSMMSEENWAKLVEVQKRRCGCTSARKMLEQDIPCSSGLPLLASVWVCCASNAHRP
jgi:hypothetical protein